MWAITPQDTWCLLCTGCKQCAQQGQDLVVCGHDEGAVCAVIVREHGDEQGQEGEGLGGAENRGLWGRNKHA